MRPSAIPDDAMANHRILILDDDPFMLTLLSRTLERFGEPDALTCQSGDDALAALAASAPAIELILLDVNMPGMDGVEFIRRLVRQRYAGAIVLVSGEASRTLSGIERLVTEHRLHSLGVLSKPVDPEALARLLTRLSPTLSETAEAARPPASACTAESLAEGIARKEFFAVYQPQVSMRDGAVSGVEALIRWRDRSGMVHAPQYFIDVAEQCGAIGQLTGQMLDCACSDLSRWRRSGLFLSVAVNVSMTDLEDLEFPDRAVQRAAAAGVDPAAITLEITESKVLTQLSTVLDVLARLRLKRFRLSIDDFGTGHSSLAQLRDLPFDELKIDRGFVHSAAVNPTLRAICSASLRMAGHLRLHTVAEGVEARDDWMALRNLGCRSAQGYWISRPLPAADMPAWIAAWDATARSRLGILN